ncbi:lytic polysaccharide monooxygenase auxiliary activity family 9 protein [Streptomyces viridochromogenes]|uniref:lytic polysaccharide monooxygenase auxiliary activity family 9 protein n=1 Tax=Streptomyces viridochromogenes TaxID=1938 RepID=UPI00069FBCB8|nr:lytic polysaccharide monooxygenase [Streptomyces viridochromogenes]KOG08456.1 chitin-binding protein [Streptomyces viridochromogenes]KOG09067.1 chitin-binding protein [Streptomyces viridochromogenes]
MPWMRSHRTALAATAVAPLLLTVWAAGPARAHGAPTDPVSRVYACSPDGGSASRSAACRAAVASNDAPFTAWDNLRIANVNGRDRQVVPDGELCSGGLPAYRGLDLARADWPSTRLTPGSALTMRYVSTIPHTGTFKLYLTKPGYDPAKPLAWADLPEKPFAEVKDPALTDGAYRIRAALPSDRTGRHVLYTIWQNSSTPDTYYSCSDVVFPAGRDRDGDAEPSGGGGGESTASAAANADRDNGRTPAGSSSAAEPRRTDSPTPSAAADARSRRTPDSAAPDSTPVAATGGAGSGPSAPLLAGGAAAVLVLTGGAALALRLRRR